MGTKERKMTKAQRDFIDLMNEVCNNKFHYTEETSLKEAQQYISKNITDYQLQTMDDWQLKYM